MKPITTRSLSKLCLVALLLLTGCSSKEKQLIEQYQADPFKAQADARLCVQKRLRHESIIWEATCQAIVRYQRPHCEAAQKAGALVYQNYNCEDADQVLWMTMAGN